LLNTAATFNNKVAIMQNLDAMKIRSVREAAELCGLSVSRMNRFRCEGGGPKYCQLGTGKRARIGYRLTDLESWLESRVRSHTGQGG
jgi:predicted DNA-binding transcriptional regulator AlpA